LTAGALVVAGVAAGLARDARSLHPGIARGLLLALFLFLLFEWAAHFIGSRWWGPRVARADRAAFAALSSAGLWIALLAIVPFSVRELGLAPTGTTTLVIMVTAVCVTLALRLWFLREIYEVEFDRAVTIWAATRGAAAVLVFAVAALYLLAGSVGEPPPPALSLHP
jgi:hypothetical protein